MDTEDITIHYDLDRKTIVIEIPYDGKGDYDLSESGKTNIVASNLKINTELDTGLNVTEHFFLTVGCYRYVNAPRRRGN